MAYGTKPSMARKRTMAQETLRLTKIPVQAYLEPEQAADLKALSARTRVPQQAYIREGVDLVLARYAKK
jgi:hypothetical protein